jgi:hypothetical protein
MSCNEIANVSKVGDKMFFWVEIFSFEIQTKLLSKKKFEPIQGLSWGLPNIVVEGKD